MQKNCLKYFLLCVLLIILCTITLPLAQASYFKVSHLDRVGLAQSVACPPIAQ